MKSTKPKTKDDSKWPKVYTRRYPSGQVAYIVDLEIINGKRERYTKETLEEARTYAEQARIKRNNESLAAFALSSHIQRDAQQAHEKLKPYDISLTTAADYYIKHVVAYRNAPPTSSFLAGFGAYYGILGINDNFPKGLVSF